jgi:outer membrane protein assembly factor BamB
VAFWLTAERPLGSRAVLHPGLRMDAYSDYGGAEPGASGECLSQLSREPATIGRPRVPGADLIGDGDEALYAFDKTTGREVWRTPLPRRTTPMTYRSRSGRQFVVIATGSGTDQTLVAFAAPPRGQLTE